jgi:hypothetical protein
MGVHVTHILALKQACLHAGHSRALLQSHVHTMHDCSISLHLSLEHKCCKHWTSLSIIHNMPLMLQATVQRSLHFPLEVQCNTKQPAYCEHSPLGGWAA